MNKLENEAVEIIQNETDKKNPKTLNEESVNCGTTSNSLICKGGRSRRCIWKKSVAKEVSKSDENYKFINPKTLIIPTHKTHEENHTKADHNQTVENKN